MSEKIKRYDFETQTKYTDANGEYVYVSDLLSGHVLEHEGKRYRLVPEEVPNDGNGRPLNTTTSYTRPSGYEDHVWHWSGRGHIFINPRDGSEHEIEPYKMR